MPQPVEDDSTIRLTPPVSAAAGPARSRAWLIAAPTSLVAVAAIGTWLLWPTAQNAPRPATAPLVATREAVQTPPQPGGVIPATGLPTPSSGAAGTFADTAVSAADAMAATAQSPPSKPQFTIETATEQQILDHVPAPGAPDPTVFRFQANPRILVLDFASLLDQGRTLNRVAALSEKTGLPHDRVLSDSELDQAVRASGDTVETYYYGHDYGASELSRFFALGDHDSVRMVSEEDGLRRLLSQEGWFEPNAQAALISIPQVGADIHVTRSARETILHHELSHGEYFTNPAYAAFVHRFWTQTLTAPERTRIRRHLHSQGYDSNLDEVMENEAQAYLMFTESPDFFTPEMIGISKARLSELRTGFFRSMPPGWLRDSLGQFLSTSRTAAMAHP